MLQKALSTAVSVVLAFAPAIATAQSSSRYETSLGDPVLHWNSIALQAVVEDHTGEETPEQKGPTRTSRALAIVHAAIYDSVNSIDRSYEPYLTSVMTLRRRDYSTDAAVAAAARYTLMKLYPSQAGTFEIEYQKHIRLLGNSSDIKRSVQIGNTVAKNIIRERRNDGADAPEYYSPFDMPGFHRVDPMNEQQGFYTPQWGNVEPFAMNSVRRFRAPPPPALDSAEYLQAYNEVKIFGGDGEQTATVRTEEQAYIGIYWGYDGAMKVGPPPRFFNQIAQVIAKQENNTIEENARLFALINMAMADAGIASWDSKYYYHFWRPVVAIREADKGMGPLGYGDGNPLTIADSEWMPLGAPASNKSGNNFSPPFPAYPSGHATFGAAAFKVMELFYGTDNVTFTVVSDEYNGVTTDNVGNVRPYKPRTFTSFSQAALENAQSRIYIGVHWQFDATEGIKMGNSIAEYTYKKMLQEKRRR